MDIKIDPSWKSVLAKDIDSDYFNRLVTFVKGAYAAGPVYPPERLIFNAFNLTPPGNISEGEGPGRHGRPGPPRSGISVEFLGVLTVGC